MAGTLADFSRATGIRVVTRAQWGARAPKTRRTISLPSARLWIHHTADDRQGESIDEHQDFHMDVRGWSDIAYSLLVDNNGVVYEGRGIGVAGGHTAGDNTQSHAICLLGNFENRTPPVAMQNTVVALARFGRDAGWWVPTMGGHRDAPGANTACPGRHAYALLPTWRTRVAGTAPTTKDWFDMATEADLTAAVAKALDSQAKRVFGITSWEAYMEALIDAARKGSRTGVSDERLHQAANDALRAVLDFEAGAKQGPLHEIVRQVLAEDDTPAPPS